jgi:predicted NAD/FAD-binding protein
MKIAVIGGGISGMGAAVILGVSHEVHLFEADSRLGGHAHTVEIADPSGPVPLDTGFLVYNELNYPQLTAFFRYLNVETALSDMSLSVKSEKTGLEWCGTNLNTVFGQRRNLVRPSFIRMLLDILRFHREAEANLALSRRHGWSLRDLLREGAFTPELAADYLLPIGAAIWSTPEKRMLDYPADTFLAFFLNHKLLQVNDRPVWRTVRGGSIEYVKKARELIPHLHLNEPVRKVTRETAGIRLATDKGELVFDRVVFATHAPITLRLLQDASLEERSVLGAIGVEGNKAVLHRDSTAMPRTRRCWSAWNVSAGVEKHVSLTYHLNRLQPVKSESQYFLSLNPLRDPRDVVGTYQYDHPVFNREAIRAQGELLKIQGKGGVYFAGAWTRYGFHEDGLRSAVNVARLIGEDAPWKAA